MVFNDFSFLSATSQQNYVMDLATVECLDPATPSDDLLVDEGYCSSETNASIAELSRDFDRQSLEPSRLETSVSCSHTFTPTAHPRRPSLSRNHLSSVRQQRQLATRRQCSTENLARISHLVERMLHDGDSDYLANRSAVRIVHQEHYHPSNCGPSIADTTSSTPAIGFTSPGSPMSDGDSDHNVTSGISEHPFGISCPSNAMDGERAGRRTAVEKTIRMRKRPTGRIPR
ncbi:hypothetical protein MMC13_005063 [Lambiella insularis]|nr:hypothetical protein [Lambiella insularis]